MAFGVALPYGLYQLWAFVAPGSTSTRKVVMPLIVSSTLLFLCRRGVLLLFRVPFCLFPALLQFAPPSVSVAPDIGELTFVLGMFLVLGWRSKRRLVSYWCQRAWSNFVIEIRRYRIVGAFAVAAFVTPPDAVDVGIGRSAVHPCTVGLLCARLRWTRHLPYTENTGTPDLGYFWSLIPGDLWAAQAVS